MYYPASFHTFYEADSPSRIPFNAGPEAFQNLEEQKFIALPIKRNSTRAPNENQTGVVKLWNQAAQRVMRRATGIGGDASPNASNTTLESFGRPSVTSQISGVSAGGSQQQQTSDIIDFESILSEHITALLQSSERRSNQVAGRSSVTSSNGMLDPKARYGREKEANAPAFRTVSLSDAIYMNDMENVREPQMIPRRSPSPRMNALSADDKRQQLEESERSWNQLLNTSISFLPTKYEWASLIQLRVFAGAPEKSEKGVEKLAYYFSILSRMENTFHLDLNQIKFPFTWFEAYFPDRKVTTNCIHYEKASVLFNIAAIYSQMGSTQRLWDKDGKKLAASYFQKAAGVLTHLRDTLWHRFQIRLENISDLSEETLTAAIHLMLAQAVECYYDKATEEGVKSTVTSMIAAQTADYYEVAIRQARLNVSMIGKSRFAKEWITTMNIKWNFFGSVAHFHAPLSLPEHQALGERIARLNVAKDLAQKAFKLSKDAKGGTKDLLNAYLSVVSSAQLLADAANFERYHHAAVDPRILHPLKKPNAALAFPWPFEAIVGDVERFPDMFGSVMSVAYQSDVSSLFATHLRMIQAGNAELQSCLFSIDRAVEEIEPDLSHTVNETGTQSKQKLIERASQLNDKLNALRSNAVTKNIQESLDKLSQVYDFISSNLQKAMELLENITVSGETLESVTIERCRQLKMDIVHLSEQLIVARLGKKSLQEEFRVESAEFDPNEWTLEKLQQLIPMSDNAEFFDFERRRREQLGSIWQQLKTTKRDIEVKLRELKDLEKKISEEIQETPTDKDILQRMQERRSELKVYEESISALRALKDKDLTMLKQLKEQSLAGPISEYDESMKIIQSFERSVECLLMIQQNLRVDLEEIAKIREQSIHLLTACHQLQNKRDPKSGDGGNNSNDADFKVEGGHPLLAPMSDPMATQILDPPGQKPEPPQRGIMKRSGVSRDLNAATTSNRVLFSRDVPSSSDQTDIDGYLNRIAGIQKEEIARLSLKHKILERETQNAADAERKKREDVGRIGTLAYTLFENASKVSTIDLIGEALNTTITITPPAGSSNAQRGFAQSQDHAIDQRMERVEYLKQKQRDLLAKQADEKAALAAKQVAEHAELMRQHQNLVQQTKLSGSTIPTRRPSTKPVRFAGIDPLPASTANSTGGEMAADAANATGQYPPNSGTGRTAPPTNSNLGWPLSSDKIKQGLMKLVGMGLADLGFIPDNTQQQQQQQQQPQQPQTTERSISGLGLPQNHPFGPNLSRKSSYAANIEMLENKNANIQARVARPTRNMSTSSAYDTYYDAVEPADDRMGLYVDERKDAAVQVQVDHQYQGMLRNTNRVSDNSLDVLEGDDEVPLHSSRNNVDAYNAFMQRRAAEYLPNGVESTSPGRRETSRDHGLGGLGGTANNLQAFQFHAPPAPNHPPPFASVEESHANLLRSEATGTGLQFSKPAGTTKPGLTNWVEEQRKLSPTRKKALNQMPVSVNVWNDHNVVESPTMLSETNSSTSNFADTSGHPHVHFTNANNSFPTFTANPSSPKRSNQVSGGLVVGAFSPNTQQPNNAATSPKRKPVDTSFLNSGFQTTPISLVGGQVPTSPMKALPRKARKQGGQHDLTVMHVSPMVEITKDIRQDSGIAGVDSYADLLADHHVPTTNQGRRKKSMGNREFIFLSFHILIDHTKPIR
ncbi:Tyrosine-protein phosphatase non-receptor type 23 [Phlyctochytrium planicorne]|nr:Tyrosine-protein phosphatase non-receptor type 23 [Phlyctochytrium planicorne]